MVKFVLGPSGSGKTRWLIERANKDKREGNGNIVFIDTDDSHIFTLDHNVRLINAKEYMISNTENLFGFLSGIISRDYDIEKIYLDGIYEIVNYDKEGYALLLDKLNKLSDKYDVEFLIGLNISREDLPESAKEDAEELNI